MPDTTHVVIGGDSLANLQTIRGSQPELRMEETDQTAPAGRWVWRSAGDGYYLSRQLTANDWDLGDTADVLTFNIATVAQGFASYIGSITMASDIVSELTRIIGAGGGEFGSLFRYAATVTAGAFSGSIIPFEARGQLSGATTQNFTATIGIRGLTGSIRILDNTNTLTVTGVAAIVAEPLDTALNSTNVTITNLYGLYVFNAAAITAGTLTNQYGIYIEDLTRGGTLDVGIYIAGADSAAIYVAADPVRLADSVTLGLGTGTGIGSPDATLTYNGTNVVLNPAVIGSGVIVTGGNEGGTTIATGTTLRAPDITTGGAGNIAGADITLAAGLGTGTGDEGTIIFQLPIVAAAGDNIQTRATRLTLDMAGSSTQMTATLAQDVIWDGGDTLIANGRGWVVGNSGQDTTNPLGTIEAQVLGTATVDSGLFIARYSADTGGTVIAFQKSRSTTIGARTAVNSGDAVAEIIGYAAGSSAYRIAGYIDLVTESAGGANGVAGAWIIYTGTTAGTTEALRLNSAQNLSFRQGTTSPVLDGAVADVVSLAAVDYAAGDRRLNIQAELGSAIILGNNTVRATWATQAVADATVDLGVVSGTTYDLVRITSSLQHKELLPDYEIPSQAIYALPLAGWRSRASDAGRLGYSPIAEWAHKASPTFAQLDEDGNPIGINWYNLNTAVLREVQGHEARIQRLERQLIAAGITPEE